MSTSQPILTRHSLAEDLEAAGIGNGDIVVIHSSMKNVGWVDGGLLAVIEAFQDVVTRSGTLVFPTFTFNLASWNMPAFEPWRTPSRVGKLTNFFWHLQDVKRTNHPTHSVAAWGACRDEIIDEEDPYEPLGINSPLDRARKLGGKILLLGVGNERNSTVHVAESVAGMPYLDIHFDETDVVDAAYYRTASDGQVKRVEIQEMPGSSEGFYILNDYLYGAGVTKKVRVGGADSWIMKGDDLVHGVIRLLKNDPIAFLKGPAPTEISLRRRRFMDQLLAAG